MSLEGKIAVVTGAARGIGAAIAQRLFDDHVAGLAILDINQESIEITAQSVDPSASKVFGYCCNIASRESVKEVFTKILAKFGRIDILVNNAGITRDAMFHKMTDDQWDSVISVNLNGIYNCCKVVVPGMRIQKYGKIVNLASVSAFGNVGQTNYSASKAAVIGFTKSLAREIASCNCTVNAIAPSYVDTDMLHAVPENILAKFIESIPAKRLAQPSEIASVVSFLSSDDSSFVNGECIVVSGGSYT